MNLIAEEFASFLDYDIFQGIVEEYSLDEGQQQLRYPEYLKTYVETHKISEFLEINPALEKYSGAKELVLKFDISVCKVATLLDLKSAVADILRLKSSSIRILSIKEGCVLITFLIPEFIANIIFTRNKQTSHDHHLKDFQDLLFSSKKGQHTA